MMRRDQKIKTARRQNLGPLLAAPERRDDNDRQSRKEPLHRRDNTAPRSGPGAENNIGFHVGNSLRQFLMAIDVFQYAGVIECLHQTLQLGLPTDKQQRWPAHYPRFFTDPTASDFHGCSASIEMFPSRSRIVDVSTDVTVKSGVDH